MEELIEFCLQSTGMLLRASGSSLLESRTLVEQIRCGRLPSTGNMRRYLRVSGIPDDAIIVRLSDVLVCVSKVIQVLRQETANDADLHFAATSMMEGAGLAEEIGAGATAYNLYEIAYHVGSIYDRPALDVAIKLRALSNPENLDQYHSAIWRLAIERMRRACGAQCQWLEALDALELALTCGVPNPGLQADLFKRLLGQVRRAEGTVAEGLVGIVLAQAPEGAWDATLRRKAREEVARARLGEAITQVTPQVLELFALSEAQVMLDDLRLGLDNVVGGAREILWTNLSYRYSRLASSVPAGQSLIAHPFRSAILMLDLAHEITHAMVLQGPIGMRQAAYRAAMNYAELMLIDLSQQQTKHRGAPKALRNLPTGAFAGSLARRQLQAAVLAHTERSVWRSWLEGVSLYIELLCDPADDPAEIFIVHSAIRSLIDFNIPRAQGESDSDYELRYSREVSEQFERFYSAALKRRTRLNHLQYFNDENGSRRDDSDLYVFGYLVVRSVVSSWERTLARRLPPVVAAKLLLNATQIGVAGLYELSDEGGRSFADKLTDRYLDWIEQLSALSFDALNAFFTPVDLTASGRMWIWLGGAPVEAADADAPESMYLDQVGRVEEMLLSTMGLSGFSEDELATRHADLLVGIFREYLISNSLLPIGSARPRLLFLDASGRVGICLRTYGGVPSKSNAEPYDADVHDARYNLRYWSLPGGAEAAEALRRACGVAGTDRPHAVRIIDLVGHPDAPVTAPGVSYICSFLKDVAKIIRLGNRETDIAKEYPDFTSRLEQRIFPNFELENEKETIGDVSYLANRLSQFDPSDALVAHWMKTGPNDLALTVARMAACRAFAGGNAAGFNSMYAEAMKNTGYRLSLAEHLSKTGRSGPSTRPKELNAIPLTDQLLSASSHSGVAPYGETR